jgi:hypothetical protein
MKKHSGRQRGLSQVKFQVFAFDGVGKLPRAVATTLE